MQTKCRPQRFPQLIAHNETARNYQTSHFLGGPVRILRTILKWRRQLRTGIWFAN